jgi:hypothetical protein
MLLTYWELINLYVDHNEWIVLDCSTWYAVSQ